MVVSWKRVKFSAGQGWDPAKWRTSSILFESEERMEREIDRQIGALSEALYWEAIDEVAQVAD